MKLNLIIFFVLFVTYKSKLTQKQGIPLQNSQPQKKQPRKAIQQSLASPLMMNSMMGAQVMSPFAQGNTMFQGSIQSTQNIASQLPGQGVQQQQSQFAMPILNVPEICDHPKKQAFKIVAEAIKHQKRFLINEIQKFLEKSKYVIGMSEVKMTRILRRQLMGLMESYASLTPENVMYVNQLGQAALQNSDYADRLAQQMLVDGDMKPVDEEGNEVEEDQENSDSRI